jgi:alpha-tubulin suppressor-like RCC1 family protein
MGSNKDGKLGLGLTYQELNRSTSPRLVESLTDIVQISAGEGHSIAVDRKWQAYGWGQADNGAIGMRLSSACLPIYIKVGDP